MVKKKHKRKAASLVIILFIVGLVLASALLLFVLTLVGNGLGFSRKLLLQTLRGPYYWKLEVIGFAVFAAFLGFKGINKLGKKSKDFTEGEDAKLMTIKDMKRSEQFRVTTYQKVGEYDDGVLLGAEQKKRKGVEVVLTKEPQHTLVIGTTGSGKTTGFLDPMIQVLAQTKSKPSLIISDPKGELFDKHSQMLEARGYKVFILDLSKPYQSAKWNPFTLIINHLENLEKLKKELKELEQKLCLERNNEALIGKSYSIKVEMQEVEDELYENAVDLVYSICPIEEKTKDPSWQKGARDFILAVVLGFIEDAQKGYFALNQLNLFNLYHNISIYAKGDLKILKEYLEDRDKFSQVTAKAATVLSSADAEKTLAGYLTDVASYMQWLTDRGIQNITASSDLDFQNFDESPTALFIKVPDERDTRHTLVSILVTQCYKTLINKARKNEVNGETDSARLKRRVYFLLDEFGNLPKFENLGAMISVGRSRQVYFAFILQNFEQLDEKYGGNVAKIAKDNCPIKIFLGTDSIATMEEFIKLAGRRKGDSVSISSGGEGKGSTNTSVKEISLINISDLKTLNNADDFGNALVSAFGYPLFYSKFTPSWKVEEYKIGHTVAEEPKVSEIVDLKQTVFDVGEEIKKRHESMKDMQEIDRATSLRKLDIRRKKLLENMVLSKETQSSPKDVLKKIISKSEYEAFVAMSIKEQKTYIQNLLQSTTSVSLKVVLKHLLMEKDYKGEKDNDDDL